MFKLPAIKIPVLTGTDNGPSVRQLEKRQVLGNFGVGKSAADTAWTYQPSHDLPDGFSLPQEKDYMYEIR